ncbi:hypothetical protein GCM10009633_23930 [Janibacter melonis]|uniref:DUF4304 domain-containing protein n=1 Tax=Janibacter melonis TaxID=262209 RepID=UPI001E488C13|nr:DUF4304 domain-containing protein [Janibacter melonis]MCB5993221.1 DUF4304 domain-containing protein [Janibacter melonis]
MNIVQKSFNDFMKDLGFQKKAGSWYRSTAESIVVVELQKSQYGHQYYVNLAAWLLAIGDATFPKENACHIRLRLSMLLSSEEQDMLSDLLDLDVQMSEESRAEGLSRILELRLAPAVESLSTTSGLKSPSGAHLVSRALVDGDASEILDL